MPSCEKIKDVFAIAQSIVTIMAILAGGYWFYRQEQARPRLKIEHRISTRPFATLPKRNLFAIDIFVFNVGFTPLALNCGHLKVFDINPSNGKDPALVWSPQNGCLPNMRLEPGESDQVHEEVALPETVTALRIRSFFTNPSTSKPGYGWEYTSVYDVAAGVSEAKTSTAESPAQSSGETPASR